MTRREAARLLAGVGLVALPAWPARAAAPPLNVFTWAEYDDPRYRPGFDAAHPPPRFSFFGDAEEAFAKVRAGYAADIAHPCSNNVNRWHDAGLIDPVDVTRLSHWERIYPEFKTLRGVSRDGAIWFVPWEWGNESVIYRTDLVQLPEDSLSIFLDQRYKGRLAMIDSIDSAAYVGGALVGAAKPFDMTDDEIARAKEVLRRIHANLRFYWTDNTQMEQAIASGEVVAAGAWNDAYVKMTRRNIPVRFMRPKEGLLSWVCGIVLLKNHPGDRAAAYDYIDAMLSPECGKAVLETLNYGHANRDSLALVDPKLVGDLGFADVDAFLGRGIFNESMSPDVSEKVTRMFNEVKSGY
jgi:spermidine/putrescine-binding protein